MHELQVAARNFPKYPYTLCAFVYLENKFSNIFKVSQENETCRTENIHLEVINNLSNF